MDGLFFFPDMHPFLVADLPAGVHLLDPGLAPGTEPWRRPQGLPLDPAELKAFLREFEQFRQQVKNPKDLALLAGSSNGHFFAQTSFAVREELEDHLHPERVAARNAKSAQLTLCLSYMMEENVAELAGTQALDARFSRSMAESLGLNEEDADEELTALVSAAHTPPLPDTAWAAEFCPPWRQILPAFWSLAPKDAGFFIRDPEIVATLLDAGLTLIAPTEAELACWFPDKVPQVPLLTGHLSGWRLLGKSRPDPEALWLDLPRPIVVQTT